MLNKKKINTIAKKCVRNVGEFDKRGTGHCVEISRCIANKLEKEGMNYPTDIYLIEPILKEKGKTAFGYHQAVILPKKRLIVDTQLWQLKGDKRPDLSKRKVIFTYEEYRKKKLHW